MKFATTITSIGLGAVVCRAYDFTWEIRPSGDNGERCKNVGSCNQSGSNVLNLGYQVTACTLSAGLGCRYDVTFHLLDPSSAAHITSICQGGSADEWLAIDLKPIQEISGFTVSSLTQITGSFVDIKVTTQSAATENCAFGNYQLGQQWTDPPSCNAFSIGGFEPKNVVMEKGSSTYNITLDFDTVKNQDSPLLLAKPNDWTACGTEVKNVEVDWLRFYGGFPGGCLWCSGASFNMAAGAVVAAVLGWLLW